MAIAALVLGIVALVLFFSCGLGILAGILAIIFGFLGRTKAKETGTGSGMALTGLILGAVGVVAGIAFIVAIVVAADEGSDAISDALSDIAGPADPDDYDVESTACAIDSVGLVTVEGSIENTSDEEKNFEIVAEIREPSSGRLLDDPSTFVYDIPAGRTVSWEILGSVGDGVTRVECRVAEVNNFMN